MLVHRRVTPQQYVAGTHLYTWVERDNHVGQSILSKETSRWQGLGVEPPTFRSKSHALTTTPPLPPKENVGEHNTMGRLSEKVNFAITMISVHSILGPYLQ